MSMTIFESKTVNGITVNDLVDNNDDQIITSDKLPDNYFIRLTACRRPFTSDLSPCLAVFSEDRPFEAIFATELNGSFKDYLTNGFADPEKISAELNDFLDKYKPRIDEYAACDTVSDDKHYRVTPTGFMELELYIAELNARRKEILDAGLDTADETNIPTATEIFEDAISFGLEEDGCFINGWGVTDNYDADRPICLKLNRDVVEY